MYLGQDFWDDDGTSFRDKETCEKACEFLNTEDNKKGK